MTTSIRASLPAPLLDDPDRCYAAVSSRDARFDGWIVLGVTSTGIYCRPSCPARTPRREHVRFFPTAAAAQQRGFRACRRCRPDAAPGSPAWDLRADLVGRAMRSIADGAVDRDGVEGLARQLGYTARHLHRVLVAEVGAGPQALARAQRAQTARILIETTTMPFGEVAFAAGFASIRQFNATVQEVFAAAPRELRRRAVGRPSALADRIALRLPLRTPADLGALLDHLTVRAVPGLEERIDARTFRRSLALPGGAGVVELTVERDHVAAHVHLDDLRDLTAAVSRIRRLLDLDADPEAVDAHLARDPALRPLVRRRPGLRVPHGPDGVEAVLRTVLGQQVSLAGARTTTGALVRAVASPLRVPLGAVTHRPPTAEELAAVDPGALPLPRSRARALVEVAVALASGDLTLDPGADRHRTRRELAAIAGIGPWSTEMVALRGLGDPDAFPASDLVLRRHAARLGVAASPAALRERAVRWAPWRGYAAGHLWADAADRSTAADAADRSTAADAADRSTAADAAHRSTAADAAHRRAATDPVADTPDETAA